MNKKTIAFDCRYIVPDSQDGISRFSTELFHAVSRSLEITAIISDPRQLEHLPRETKYIKLHKPTSLLEPLSALFLNKHKFDVVFSPMQTIGSMGKRFRLVLTVHDLIYYSHPKPPAQFNWFIKLLWRLYHTSYLPQKLLLSGADQIVTVSETTKALIGKHRLTDKPITVVPNAASKFDPQPADVQKKIIYMGSFMPYKNVDQLIYGISHIDGYKLVLLSRINEAEKVRLRKLANKLNVELEFEHGVTDAEYAYHLSTATALVHASSDEGFGIPIIEAMSVGCPVVCSDIPIFREIAGEAGLFFTIGNHQQFAERVAEASKKRRQLDTELKAQAAKFNWDKSGRVLADLLRRP